LAPTPQRGARLTVARLKQLLSKHRIRRWTAEELREVLTAPPLPLAAGSADAISEHALLLLPQLRLLYSQRKEVRDRIEALLNQMTAQGREHPERREHRDVGILLSLPGVGCIIAANLFTEGSDPLGQRDYYALRNHSGVGPLTKQSGKSRQVVCDAAVASGCEMRCITGLAPAFSMTLSARNIMLDSARSGTNMDGRSAELRIVCWQS